MYNPHLSKLTENQIKKAHKKKNAGLKLHHKRKRTLAENFFFFFFSFLSTQLKKKYEFF